MEAGGSAIFASSDFSGTDSPYLPANTSSIASWSCHKIYPHPPPTSAPRMPCNSLQRWPAGALGSWYDVSQRSRRAYVVGLVVWSEGFCGGGLEIQESDETIQNRS